MVHERIIIEQEEVYLREMASLQLELEKLEQSSQGKSQASPPDLVGQCGMWRLLVLTKRSEKSLVIIDE